VGNITVSPDKAEIIVKDKRITNTGGESTQAISVRLYLSKAVDTLGVGPWSSAQSEEPGFPSAFYYPGYGWLGKTTINPLETLTLPTFNLLTQEKRLTEPLAARVKSFYGARRPIEAAFRIPIKN
jgi:hypothetical protein